VAKLQTQTRVVNRTFWRERLAAQVFVIFASLAVLLAMCGVYGVLSYAVAERTTEIGIRLAMGASRQQVLGFIVLKGARIAALGVGIGVVASFLSTRMLAGLLYGVQPADPVILSGVALTLLLVATAATAVPAFRASRLDPLTAIRRA
jgi:ABC-type antimicrobial peptide transport system permease subunit